MTFKEVYNLTIFESGKVKIGSYTEEGDEVIKAILSKGELFVIYYHYGW